MVRGVRFGMVRKGRVLAYSNSEAAPNCFAAFSESS